MNNINRMVFAWILLFSSTIFTVTCRVERKEEKKSDQPAVGSSVSRVAIAYFGPEPGADLTMNGLMDGLKKNGFNEGTNLEIHKTHANGEIAGIPLMLQNLDSQDFDLIIAMTTPVLTGACAAVRNTPVVFMYVYDPIAAGAGKSFTDHLPHITGVGSFPPVEETVNTIQTLVPDIKRVGTIYNSSEANSRKVMEVGREAFTKRGIHLEEVTVTGTSEVFQAAQVVAARDVQALWITGDNTSLLAFDGIAKVAGDSGLPLIINDPEFVQRGALTAVGIGWYQSGVAAAKPVSEVLRGKDPKDIPFENVAKKELVLNFDIAKKLGISFPEEMMQQAKR